jgi:hypothetical protein
VKRIRLFTLPRRLTLAVAVATVWGMNVSCALASSVFVQNCADDGSPTSLRGAIAAANLDTSIDTVDLSDLPAAAGCTNSSITLTMGEIPVSRASLTIKGPSTIATINARSLGRVFGHTGSGTLAVENLDLFNGYAYYKTATTRGGCIYSHGSVYLKNSEVGYCYARSVNGDAEGGAIFTMGTTTLSRSKVIESSARSFLGTARGGGVFFFGGLRAKYSTLSDNAVLGDSAFGGAASTTTGATSVYLLNTTMSGNYSTDSAGAIAATVSSNFTMINSTIANNSAGSVVGGAFIIAPTSILYNSTIAFNTATGSAASFAAGLYISGSSGSTLKMNSMLISNNVAGNQVASDLATDNVTVSGAHNLIYAATSALPGDTLVGRCPLLAPLSSNGGQTQTMSLHSGSPAIDAGNNVRSTPLNYDQRGSPFARLSGTFPDIGSIEVNKSDIIFDVGFEGCP